MSFKATRENFRIYSNNVFFCCRLLKKSYSVYSPSGKSGTYIALPHSHDTSNPENPDRYIHSIFDQYVSTWDFGTIAQREPLNVHLDIFSGARRLKFGPSLHLHSYFV